MTQHMTDNKRWVLATHILEGDSFSEVADRFNISKGGAHKIFKKMKWKIFPLISERERLGIDMKSVKSLRENWGRVKMI